MAQPPKQLITAIDVSYNNALLPAPFKRWVNQHGAVNLNPSATGGTQVYLWYSATSSDADAISDVVVLYDDEPTPAGYKKVARDLSGGHGAGRSYLAYALGKHHRCAQQLFVQPDGEVPALDEPSAGATVAVCDRPINRSGPPMRIGVAYVAGSTSSGSASKTSLPQSDEDDGWAQGLAADSLVDVRDHSKRWRPGRVEAVAPDGAHLRVSYIGWSDKHAEVLPRSSARLARAGSQSYAPPKGLKQFYGRRLQAEPLGLDEVALLALELKIEEWQHGGFPADAAERDYFARQELPAAVDDVLSARLDTVQLQERCMAFLHRVIDFCVWHLRQLDAPVPKEVRVMLCRLFLEDVTCNWFYEHYGSTVPSNPIAASVDGWAARLPPPNGASRFYVSAVNRMNDSGGYDALLHRLQHLSALLRQYQATAAAASAAGGAGLERQPSASSLNELHMPRSAAAAGDTGGTDMRFSSVSSSGAGSPIVLAPSGGKQSSSSSSASSSASLPSVLDAPAAGEDPLLETFTFAGVLLVPRVCYTASWALKYYQPLRDAVLDRVLSLTPGQLKRTNRDVLDAIREKLLRLGNTLVNQHASVALDILSGPESRCAGDTHVGTALERWGLALAAQLLRTDSLALRVKAVTDIREVVDEITTAEANAARFGGGFSSSGYGSNSAVKPPITTTTNSSNFTTWTPPPRTWYDAPRLMRFLIDNSIVGLVLTGEDARAPSDAEDSGASVSRRSRHSDRVHVQTVSRVGPILRFLASHIVPVSEEASLVSPQASEGGSANGRDAEETASFASSMPPAVEIQPGLSGQHIDALLLLAANDDGDEEMQRTVFELLSSLLAPPCVLPLPLLLRCVASFEKKLPSTLDVGTIKLLRDLTDAGLEAVQRERLARRQARSGFTSAIGAGAGARGRSKQSFDIHAIDEDDNEDEDEKRPDSPLSGEGAVVNQRDEENNEDEDDDAFLSNNSNWFLLPELIRLALKLSDATSSQQASAATSRPVSSEVVSAAAEAVVSLLQGRSRHSLHVVKMCCENLQEGRCVVDVISLMQAIFRGYNRADPAFQAIIQYVKGPTFDFLPVIVREIARYKEVAAAAAASAGLQEKSVGTELQVDGRSHIDNVQFRLRFLHQLQRATGSQPSFSDVSALWSALVDAPLCDEESEAFFAWFNSLRKRADQHSPALVSKGMYKSIFLRLLCDPSRFKAERIGPEGYEILEFCFRYYNIIVAKAVQHAEHDVVKLKGLKAFRRPEGASASAASSSSSSSSSSAGAASAVHGGAVGSRGSSGAAASSRSSSSSSSGEKTYVRLNLLGLQQLWAVVEEAKDASVAKKASDRIIQLHASALALDDADNASSSSSDSELGKEQTTAVTGSAADGIDDLYGPGPSGAGAGASSAAAATSASAKPGTPSDPGDFWFADADGADDIDDASTDSDAEGEAEAGDDVSSGVESYDVVRRSVWESFVRDCMQRIKQRMDAIAAARANSTAGSRSAVLTSTRTIARLMKLLTSLLHTIEQEHLPAEDRLSSYITFSQQDNATVVRVEGCYAPRLAEIKPDMLTIVVREHVPDPAATTPPTAAGPDGSAAPLSAPATKVVIRRVLIECRSHLETIGALRDRVCEALGLHYVRFFTDPPNKTSAPRRVLGPPVNGLTLAAAKLPLTLFADGVSYDEVSSDAEAAAHRRSSLLQRLQLQLATLAKLTRQPEAELLYLLQSYYKDLSKAAKCARAPRALISKRPAFFELLFQLLSGPSSVVVADAWSLLQSLPVNARVQRDISTLRGRIPAEEGAEASPSSASAAAPPPDLDWPAILDGASPLKLLYSLEILDKRLADTLRADVSVLDADVPQWQAMPSEDAAKQQSETVTYASTESRYVSFFVASGGLSHLLRLLEQLPLEAVLGPNATSQVLYRRCAALLLKLISHFLRSPAGLRSFQGVGLDRPALLRRLLDVIATIVTAEVPRVERGKEGSALALSPSAALSNGEPDVITTPPSSVSSAAASVSSTGLLARPASSTTAASAASTSAPGPEADADSSLGLTAIFGCSDDADFEPSDADFKASSSSSKDQNDENTPEVQALNTALVLLADVLLAPTVPVASSGGGQASAPPRRALHLDAFAALTAYPSIDALLVTGLIWPRNLYIRRYFGRALICASAHADSAHAAASLSPATVVSPLTAWIAQSLLRNFKVLYLCRSNYRLYYDVILYLCTRCPAQQPEDDGARNSAALARAMQLIPDPEALVRSFSSTIAAHPVIEVGSEESDVKDSPLIFMLTLLTMVLGASPQCKELAGRPVDEGGLGLLDDVFHSCLFAQPLEVGSDAAASSSAEGKSGSSSSAPGGRLPKCKSSDARSAAFELLLELAKGCPPNAARLAVKLLPHHDPSLSTSTAKASSSADDDGGAATTAKSARFVGVNGPVAAPDVSTIGPASKASPLGGRNKNALVPPRGSSGYTGLANLGCICYMNSTIQQFFLNAAFRRGILSWTEPPSSSPSDLADSLMYQLQRQFAYLQESAKQYFAPRGLCHAIKDWEGNATDVTEQKDVPEFLTKLFADMESACQGTHLSALVKDVYGGVQIQELIAEDPRPAAGGAALTATMEAAAAMAAAARARRLYTARNDDFSFLQLRVKGNKNLHDALKEYVAGESVQYKWELPPLATSDAGDAVAGGGAVGGAAADSASSPAGGGGAKKEEVTLKTTKRVSLRSTGPSLMLHLSRFEFDYDTMQQAKLNDRFEFPRLLDLWPYTIYGREDDATAAPDVSDGSGTGAPSRSDFQYELVGVVIHMGTAIGGHYYSYIRERSAVDGPSADDRWFEFNDQFVSPWEATDEAFDRDTFGGSETVSSGARIGGGGRFNVGTYERVKSSNAFCLFYDRLRKPTAAAAVAAPAEASTAVTASAPASLTSALLTATSPGITVVPPAPGSGTAALQIQLTSDPLGHFLSSDACAGGSAAHSERVRSSLRAPIPPSILGEIVNDNLEYWRAHTIFGDPDYFAFLRELLRCAGSEAAAAAPHPSSTTSSSSYPWAGVRSLSDAMSHGGASMLLCRLAVAVITNTLPLSTQRTKYPIWLQDVRPLLRANPTACVALLQSALADPPPMLRQLLGETTNEVGRDVASELLITALSVVWPLEGAGPPPSTTITAMTSAPDTDVSAAYQWDASPWPAEAGNAALSFVDLLLATLPHLGPQQLKRSGSFFAVLQAFSGIDERARAALLSRGALGRVLSLLLGPECPHPELVSAVLAQPAVAPAAAGVSAAPIAPADRGAAAGASSYSSSASSSSLSSSSAATSAILSSIFSSSSSSTDKSSLSVHGKGAPARGGKQGNTGRGQQQQPQSISTSDDWRTSDTLNSPEFAPLLRLVLSLIRSALPPSGRTGSPVGLAPQSPLTSVDRDIITCADFIRNICGHLTSGTVAREFGPLVKHLLWGASGEPAFAEASGPAADGEEPSELPSFGPDLLVHQFARVIGEEVEEGEYDELPPAFRLAALACAVSGDDHADVTSSSGEDVSPGDVTTLQAGRVDVILRALLQAVQGRVRFYKATEAGIELLTKLGKIPAVRSWLRQHADLWRWCDAWLRAHPTPPPPKTFSFKGKNWSVGNNNAASSPADDDGSIQLHKRSGYSSSGYGNYYPTLTRDEAITSNVRRLLRGRMPHYEDYESDDEPESIIGRRVLLFGGGLDTQGTRGLIQSFDETTQKHAVALEGRHAVSLDLLDVKRIRMALLPLPEDEGGAGSGNPEGDAAEESEPQQQQDERMDGDDESETNSSSASAAASVAAPHVVSASNPMAYYSGSTTGDSYSYNRYSYTNWDLQGGGAAMYTVEAPQSSSSSAGKATTASRPTAVTLPNHLSSEAMAASLAAHNADDEAQGDRLPVALLSGGNTGGNSASSSGALDLGQGFIGSLPSSLDDEIGGDLDRSSIDFNGDHLPLPGSSGPSSPSALSIVAAAEAAATRHELDGSEAGSI